MTPVGERIFLLANAGVHLLVFVLLFAGVLPLMAAAVAASLLALGAAGYLVVRHRRQVGPILVGVPACLLSLVGWGSWVWAWFYFHGNLGGPIINITWLAAFLALPLYVVAALIPRQGDTPFGP